MRLGHGHRGLLVEVGNINIFHISPERISIHFHGITYLEPRHDCFGDTIAILDYEIL